MARNRPSKVTIGDSRCFVNKNDSVLFFICEGRSLREGAGPRCRGPWFPTLRKPRRVGQPWSWWRQDGHPNPSNDCDSRIGRPEMFCRPSGTRFYFWGLAQDLRPGLFSVAPPGLYGDSHSANRSHFFSGLLAGWHTLSCRRHVN
jgi:hypothetical protein